MKFIVARTNIAFWLCIVVVLLQILNSHGDELTQEEIQEEAEKEFQEKKEKENQIDQELGTGIHSEKDLMDVCENAAGPRPINKVFSPGRTTYATVDDVNGGFCGVTIDSPGIWWWIEGTGDPVRVSSCHLQTDSKVKFSVFSGSCDDLQCIGGSAEPDFECPLLRRDNELGEWNTFATAYTFETKKDTNYYVLVQTMGLYGIGANTTVYNQRNNTVYERDDQRSENITWTRGSVWLNFEEPEVPQNDNCPDAIGPVPRDMTRIENSNVFATVSKVFDYCGGNDVPSLYPGTWFQIMGTGEPVTVMACGQYNLDGYAFSVYHGAYCDGMECVEGRYEINVEDAGKCTFGASRVLRPLTKYTFETRDRDRYWIYVHYARTRAEKPTADFRFYVDDGKEGEEGTSGAHMIEVGDVEAVVANRGDRISRKDGEKKGPTSGGVGGFYRGGLSFVVLVASWMIQNSIL